MAEAGNIDSIQLFSVWLYHDQSMLMTFSDDLITSVTSKSLLDHSKRML